MGDVHLTAKAGAFPSNAVFEDGSIVCVQNGPAPSRAGDAAAPPLPFTALAVDAPGQRALACDASGALTLFDFLQQSYRRVASLGLPAARLAFDSHAPGRAFVALAGEGSVRVYDLASGAVLAVLAGHRQDVLALAQSPDGGTLLSASADCALLWSTADWARRRTALKGIRRA